MEQVEHMFARVENIKRTNNIDMMNSNESGQKTTAPLSLIDNGMQRKFNITRKQIHLPSIGILSYWETSFEMFRSYDCSTFNIEHRDEVWNMIIMQ